MKKIWSLLLVSSLLAGCGMYTADDTSDNDTEDTAETEEEDTSIDFVLQESDRFAQVSPMNDDALRVLSDYVTEAEDDQVGTAGELTLDYSGVYLTDEEAIYGVYLITNRTNVDMENIQFLVSQQTSGGELVLEEYPLYLGAEMFGTLEKNTAMPVYIEMDLEETSELDGEQFGAGDITLASLNFDTSEGALGEELEDDEVVDEESFVTEEEESEEDAIPEGYNFGYHPAFVLAMRQEEQLLEDIQTGNVPELTVQTPPILYNDIQGGEIMSMIRSDEIVHPASGFSQEGEMNLFWTGVSTGEYETTIFLLANRTGQELSDIDITVNFQTSDGDIILEEETINLPSYEYGSLPTDTLTPIMVDIPAGARQDFARLLNPQEGVQPQYEIVESNE